MILGFYAMLVAFIFAEIYHVFNRKRLDLIFKNKNVDSIKSVDIAFYMAKLLSIFWPIIGLFSSLSSLFLVIITINLLKFALYHASDSLYKVYINVLPWMNVAVYLSILTLRFIC